MGKTWSTEEKASAEVAESAGGIALGGDDALVALAIVGLVLYLHLPPNALADVFCSWRHTHRQISKMAVSQDSFMFTVGKLGTRLVLLSQVEGLT